MRVRREFQLMQKLRIRTIQKQIEFHLIVVDIVYSDGRLRKSRIPKGQQIRIGTWRERQKRFLARFHRVLQNGNVLELSRNTFVEEKL